jgi:hypothetical protein
MKEHGIEIDECNNENELREKVAVLIYEPGLSHKASTATCKKKKKKKNAIQGNTHKIEG